MLLNTGFIALIVYFLLVPGPAQAETLASDTRGGEENSILVTDLAGREVRLPGPAQRIILGESRYLFALSILNTKQPLQPIVGMLADLKQIDPGTYRQYQRRFPEIDQIPLVGHNTADSFSVEQVLTLKADLAIFSLHGHGPSAHHSQLIKQLQAAGVQVIFVDFREQPLKNTVKSIALLGKVLQRERQARAFIEFYQQQLAVVLEQLPTALEASVFLHSRVGLQDLCCETMVRGMMASFLDAVHGGNVAKKLVPGSAGVLNLEYLLALQPDTYIATAIGSKASLAEHNDQLPPYIVLGAEVSDDIAQRSFQQAVVNNKLTQLEAIQTKNAHAIWHHFYNSPFNVVAVQVFAKWLYPERFRSLDPHQTMTDLYDRFQPIPLRGTYWVTLQ